MVYYESKNIGIKYKMVQKYRVAISKRRGYWTKRWILSWLEKTVYVHVYMLFVQIVHAAQSELDALQSTSIAT